MQSVQLTLRQTSLISEQDRLNQYPHEVHRSVWPGALQAG